MSTKELWDSVFAQTSEFSDLIHSQDAPYQSKYWMFVLYDRNIEATFNKLSDNVMEVVPDVQFVRAQEEVCPETNRHHIQGIVQFTKKKSTYYLERRLFRIERNSSTSIYCVPAKNPDLGVDYCNKMETRPPTGWEYEFGEYSSPTDQMSSKAVQREDYKRQEKTAARQGIVAICQQSYSMEEAHVAVYEQYPDYINLFKDAWEYVQNKREAEKIKRLRDKAMAASFWEWQEKLEMALQAPADDREIIVIMDEIGGCGKTKFIELYKLKHPNTATSVMQGKTDNMLNQVYNLGFDPKVIFLDLTRYQMESANLSAIEQFKNGLVQNHKYQTGTKMLEYSPHIVIMTNKALQWRDMSIDRWKIIKLHKDLRGDVDYEMLTGTRDNLPGNGASESLPPTKRLRFE